MSLNSVNTNVGAMIALQSLNKTNADLAATQKQISTGSRVADATDDGAAFAVAQSVRSTIGALTTADQQLGTVQGLLSTTQSGLTNISNTMASMRDVLVNLSNGGNSASQQQSYIKQYKSLLANVKTFIQDSAYSGKTLIGNIAGSSGTFGTVTTVRNENGATYALATADMSTIYHGITNGTVLAETGATLAGSVAAVIKSGRHIPHAGGRCRNGPEHGRLGSELRNQPDKLQQRQDRFDEHRSWLVGGRRSGQGVGTAAGAADPPAIGHASPVAGEPGATDAAQPVQVTA